MSATALSPACRICAADAGRARLLRFFAARDTELLGLYRCAACGCEFLDPQPSPAWLQGNYAGYFAKRRASLDHPKLGFFRILLQRSGMNLSGRRVVEIGAAEGDGVLAIHSLWPDCQITAVDGHPESVPYSRDLPCQFVSEPVETWLEQAPGARFDACLMLDVIEHLRDPVAVLRDLAATRLVPGGLLLATFPNADALSRRLLGRFWPHYTTEHLYYLSRAGVAALGQRCGLQTRQLRPLPKRLPLGYALDVVSHFGPAAVRRIGRLVRRLTPRALDRVVFHAVMGEWLWVAQTGEVGAHQAQR